VASGTPPNEAAASALRRAQTEQLVRARVRARVRVRVRVRARARARVRVEVRITPITSSTLA